MNRFDEIYDRFLHVDKMSLEEVKKLMKDLKEYHLSNPDSSEYLHDWNPLMMIHVVAHYLN
ncbi:MAG TPA: hypothetical protein DCM01_14065 [Dielma fastidiosa]|nr:hypothetical protein [Dielma fastidiosa]